MTGSREPTDLDRALHASVLKREEWKEKEAREEREKHEEELRLGFGATEMSKQELRKIVDSDRRNYYRTEDLNDKLYIHYKGWRAIQNLEGWTGLKALYAECNAFDKIQGLLTCRNLRSLFLQENCIYKIEGLENCVELWNLNLSNNFISRIEGLKNCKKLNTLTIAKNRLGFAGVDDLVELADSSVCSLDVQDNKIDDPDVLPEVFARMPDLRVLYLKGNPCTKRIPNYRKFTTVVCTDLRYLDDRPVFEEDRRAADAFNRGGLEEERAERRRMREETNAKHDRNMKAFQEMVASAKREKAERDGMLAEDKYTKDTDPVDTPQKRAERAQQQWREENKEEIKDDMKEWAARCLADERAGKGAEEVAPAVSEERQDEKASDLSGSAVAPSQPEPTTQSGEKVDNRKLVYEDIWDDVPPLSAKEPKVEAPAAPAPAKESTGVFMPWADGAAGLDDLPVPTAAVERRMAELRGAASEQRQVAEGSASAAGAREAGGSSWYSKYAEKVRAVEAGIDMEKEKAKFAPPPRRPGGAGIIEEVTPTAAPATAPVPQAAAAAAVATTSEAVQSEGDAGGELDEMD